MSDSHVHVVNGPTDLPAEEQAARKRQAAVDYHTRELESMRESLKRLKAAKPVDKDKVANQQRMVDEAQAALDAAKGA